MSAEPERPEHNALNLGRARTKRVEVDRAFGTRNDPGDRFRLEAFGSDRGPTGQ